MFSRRPENLPTADAALPGRAEPLPTAEKHFVNGNPLKGPYPDGFKTAVFAMGCYWGVERRFWQVPGVWVTAVGNAGGHTPNPTYEEVCSGQTGHAEVVEIDFDEKKVSFEQLLTVFWSCHNPTQLNYQGPDIGTQYRTAIFTMDDEQAELAKNSKRIEQTSNKHSGDIATEITPAQKFWRAEEYHQQYIQKNRGRFGRLFG